MKSGPDLEGVEGAAERDRYPLPPPPAEVADMYVLLAV